VRRTISYKHPCSYRIELSFQRYITAGSKQGYALVLHIAYMYCPLILDIIWYVVVFTVLLSVYSCGLTLL